MLRGITYLNYDLILCKCLENINQVLRYFALSMHELVGYILTFPSPYNQIFVIFVKRNNQRKKRLIEALKTIFFVPVLRFLEVELYL